MKVVVGSRKRGSVLVESVVAIALLLPITIAIILVSIEANRAFVISRGMTEAAVLACRALSHEYKTNKDVVTNASEQAQIFSSIRIANLVHDNSQFEVLHWNLEQEPRTVTVRVTYIPGAGEPPLSSFPSSGALLNFGGLYKVAQLVTYRIKE